MGLVMKKLFVFAQHPIYLTLAVSSLFVAAPVLKDQSCLSSDFNIHTTTQINGLNGLFDDIFHAVFSYGVHG